MTLLSSGSLFLNDREHSKDINFTKLKTTRYTIHGICTMSDGVKQNCVTTDIHDVGVPTRYTSNASLLNLRFPYNPNSETAPLMAMMGSGDASARRKCKRHIL
jgi:hypothetical protein